MKKKILVIEDDNLSRRKIGEMFSKDYDVEYSKNGSEGLSKITHNKYDLIITDQHMPVMNGIEMLELHTEKILDEESTPIIMYTTECDPYFKKRGSGAGVDYWVIKPLNILNFYKLVTGILDKQEVLY
jgi:two-component system chemotaxis response regulator CheY